MKYFPHIDGLRAVAVISVVLFHLDLRNFKGGFVGVDIFFVISGFLITSIIVKEIEETGEFSFKKFYIRRARRLLPSLFTVLTACIVVALLFYSSERLYEFGVELLFSAISAVNIHFWLDSGYFSTRADSKLLLHIWSLCVEEQFYLIWPLTIVVAYKFLRREFFILFCALAFFASLVLNIVLSKVGVGLIENQSSMPFYLMPFRIYEFLVGVFAVWAYRKIVINTFTREGFFWAGAIAIVLSIICYDSSMLFPYYTALLPCIGALLVILSGGSRSGKFLLENKAMIFVGIISYTLYLVHWPVIVFFKNYLLVELGNIEKGTALVVIVLITLFIFYYVEKPLRSSKNKYLVSNSKQLRIDSDRIFLLSILAVSIIILLSGYALISTSGLSGYKDELISRDVINEGKVRRYDLIRKGCSLSNFDSKVCRSKRETQVLILGNSHEPDGYNIFHRMFGRDESVNLIRFGGTNDCDLNSRWDLMIFRKTSKRKTCSERIATLMAPDFINSLDIVVYSSNRPFMPNKLKSWEILRDISRANTSVDILVLGTYFNTRRYCVEIANRFNSLEQCKHPEFVSYVGNKELEKIYNPEIVKASKFIYLDKFSALCTTGDLDSCPVSGNGEPMFYDQHHLSMGFSKFIGERFLKTYKNELKDAGFSVGTVAK